jgi:hypothetical protein
MSDEKKKLREHLCLNLDATMKQVNAVLQGKNIRLIEHTLERLGRGQRLPHWFEALKKDHTLPNLDGKTVGSVVEMLFVAVLENFTFKNIKIAPLRVNPARGVDLPDLGLGIKSPSTNFCTSEPYFSAYERLLGNEYPALVLLTNYQEAKKRPPLKLQITGWRYLEASELADVTLCAIAKSNRGWLMSENEAWAQKIFRFLSFVNQSDWRARYLVRIVSHLRDENQIRRLVNDACSNFAEQNRKNAEFPEKIIPESDLLALTKILDVQPMHLGVIDAADNWVAEIQKDLARHPNENEWNRLKESPLNGKIGMSFALQWRYNFGRLFGVDSESY